MKKFMNSRRQGFTLLEILLVVAGIAILAGIVILAINPAKQLGDTRNADRRSDVNTILNAVYQYSIDNTGTLPATVTTGTTCAAATGAHEVCQTGGVCTGITDLAVLVPKFLIALPSDPQSATADGTNYD
ncbi:MAG: type II secretion system protein, partial [Patescibacteria group bacterium]|nr:type II secretion system protein [Patescibacteria group bacterium]